MVIPGPACRITEIVQKLGWKWNDFHSMEDQRGGPVAWLKGEIGWFWHQVGPRRSSGCLLGSPPSVTTWAEPS
eukprot:14282996-Alexandrium_andersonii.AAC.1